MNHLFNLIFGLLLSLFTVFMSGVTIWLIDFSPLALTITAIAVFTFIGWLHSKAIKLLKIRSKVWSIVSTIILTSLFYLGCYYFLMIRIYGESASVNIQSLFSFIHHCMTSDEVFVEGNNWFIFSLEVFVLLTIQNFFTWGGVSDPFCVKCNQWKRSKGIAFLPDSWQQITECLDNGKLNKLKSLLVDAQSWKTTCTILVINYCKESDFDSMACDQHITIKLGSNANLVESSMINHASIKQYLKTKVVDEKWHEAVKSLFSMNFEDLNKDVLSNEIKDNNHDDLIMRVSNNQLEIVSTWIEFPHQCISCRSSSEKSLEHSAKYIPYAPFSSFIMRSVMELKLPICSSCNNKSLMMDVLAVLSGVCLIAGLCWAIYTYSINITGLMFIAGAIFVYMGLPLLSELYIYGIRWQLLNFRITLKDSKAKVISFYHKDSNYLNEVEKAVVLKLNNLNEVSIKAAGTE